jgi:hypothetical protein
MSNSQSERKEQSEWKEEDDGRKKKKFTVQVIVYKIKPC